MKRTLALLLLVLLTHTGIQVPSTSTEFLDQETSPGNTLTAGCWAAPGIPTLVSPAHNTVTSASSVTFDWAESTFVCPGQGIQYQFEVYADEALTQLRYQSPWQTFSSVFLSTSQEGFYFWRIRAKDTQEYISEYSSVQKLTIDRSPPSAVTVSISKTFTKVLEESISNGEFSGLSGWDYAGNVSTMYSDALTNTTATVYTPSGSSMVRLGVPTDTTPAYTWESRIMQSFAAGAKSLSLMYNYFSRDYPSFDDPGFLVRLNGQEVFSTSAYTVNPSGYSDQKWRSTGWQTFTYDLSTYEGMINLAVSSGNTDDTSYQSWAYVDKITTYYIAAPSSAVYTFSATDTGSGIDYYRYRVDSGTWQNTASSFSGGIINNHGTHTIQVYAVDKAGKTGPMLTFNVTTDAQAPSAPSNVVVTKMTNNSITLAFRAPGDDSATGRAARYDVRYQKVNTSCSEFSFAGATSVLQVPAPQPYNTQETLTVSGLDSSSRYCIALKASDEAPNWSSQSSVIMGTTLAGSTINPGDIVINEIMWAGSSVSNDDIWVELRNMTDRTLLLDDLSLTSYTSSEYTIPINFSGMTVAPHGYFLIAKNNIFGANDSQLNVSPDIWDNDLVISTSYLQMKLKNAGILIDTAWNMSIPKEGLRVNGQKYYSMERTGIPGDGVSPLNWYTCIDALSTTDYFDSGATLERGTPGTENRSENEPAARYRIPELSASYAENNLTIGIINLDGYDRIEYAILYTSGELEKGIYGIKTLDHESAFTPDPLYLGTCSQDVCTPDPDITRITIEATVSGIMTRTLEHTLTL